MMTTATFSDLSGWLQELKGLKQHWKGREKLNSGDGYILAVGSNGGGGKNIAINKLLYARTKPKDKQRWIMNTMATKTGRRCHNTQ